jgi:hypothetical protein
MTVICDPYATHMLTGFVFDLKGPQNRSGAMDEIPDG